MRRALLSAFDQYVKLNKKIPPEILTSLSRHRRGRAPGRHRRRAPAAQARAEAAGAGDVRRQGAPGAPAVAARDRDRHPAGRKAHPRPRQAPDGEEPARVLPERAGEGDPEGTRRGRGGRRPGGDGEAHPQGAHAQGRAQEGRDRAEEAEADVADVGRGDGGAQLHRDAGQPAVAQEVEDLAGHQGRAEDPRRGPLRPGEGQGAHRRVPGGADARRQDEGADPVPGGRARRGQDLARPVDRQGDQPQVRAHVARRRARRGRDPRPPPHLHRLDAGQDPAEHDQGRREESAVPARRGGQAGPGLARRPVLGAARSAGSGAEQHLHRPLHRGRVRPVGGDVRRHREHAQHPGAAARPDGSDPALGLHRGREGQHRHAVPAAQADEEQRAEGRRGLGDRTGDPRHRALLHARGGRAQPGARDFQDLPQGGEAAADRKAGERGQGEAHHA